MRQWYYVQDSQQMGPIPEEQLIEMLHSGQLDQRALVWNEGMQHWTKAIEVSELAFTRSPPPPSPKVSGAIHGENEEQELKRGTRIKRIKALSHIIDWTIFLILIFLFDVGFILALVISMGVGWSIRLLFCK